MSNTPRKSTAPVTAEARAAARIGASKLITAAALVAADRATRSLAAAKRHPLARVISDERARGDGVWIYLPTGWRCANSETNGISEDTAAEAIAALKRAYYAPDAEDLAEIEAAAREAAAPAVNAPGFGVSMTLDQIQAQAAARRVEAAATPEAAPAVTVADAEAAEAAALAAWLPLRNARRDSARGFDSPPSAAEAAALATLRAAQAAAVTARRNAEAARPVITAEAKRARARAEAAAQAERDAANKARLRGMGWNI